MSYASGFMLGASIGRALHGVLGTGDMLPAICQDRLQHRPLKLVHGLPGRRRYYASRLIRNMPLADLLERYIAMMPFVRQVQVDVMTGSLLILYDGEKQMEELEIFLRARVFAEVSKQKENQIPRASQAVCDIISKANGIVSCHTANCFDLKSLLSFTFLFRGVRKVLVQGQRPSGPQMLWWAISLMRGWRSL